MNVFLTLFIMTVCHKIQQTFHNYAKTSNTYMKYCIIRMVTILMSTFKN